MTALHMFVVPLLALAVDAADTTGPPETTTTLSHELLKCCYDKACGGSCDGPRDYCGKSHANCAKCGGHACNVTSPHHAASKGGKGKASMQAAGPPVTESIVAVAAVAPTPAPTHKPAPKPTPAPSPGSKGKCCYGISPSDCGGSCDGPHDSCAASPASCTDCGGFFCALNASSTPAGPVRCCYGKNASQCSGGCDGPNDYCGKSAAHCADCGGHACNASITSENTLSEVSGKTNVQVAVLMVSAIVGAALGIMIVSISFRGSSQRRSMEEPLLIG